jgi:2-polyprenyl-3-methyl-5-hydroxy-6-metoxy-1,4-benzoquinol methylase
LNELKSITDLLRRNDRPIESVTIQKTTADVDDLWAKATSEEWPEAVQPGFWCSKTDDVAMKARSQAILNTLPADVDFSDKKLLDYCARTGHLAHSAAEKFKDVVGFHYTGDLNASLQRENLTLTDDLEVAIRNGPYDVIVAYDCLDHLPGQSEAVQALKIMKMILAPGGFIYVKVHPFCSRTATNSTLRPPVQKMAFA